MHGDDLAGLHVQKILQKLVGKIRCRDLQVAHGSMEASHGKGPASGEGEGCRRNEILHGKARTCQPVPVKVKAVIVTHVEHGVHELQAILAVQDLCHHTQTFEVVHQIGLNMIQTGLCLTHGLGFNAEGDIFGLGQAVIALRKLGLQHLAVLTADAVEVIVSEGNADILFKHLRIRRHVHEGQLKVDRAVEKIQEGAPLFKDRCLVLLLRQLIVDVLILNGLGIIPIAHTADAIRKHALKGNRLLRGAGNAVITLSPFDDLLHLPCLRFRQILRHVQISFFCLSEQIFHRKQCF